MKRKFKLFATLASLCLSVALMAFGVYAATNVTYNVTSTVSFAAQVAGQFSWEITGGTLDDGKARTGSETAIIGTETHTEGAFSQTRELGNVEFHPENGDNVVVYYIAFQNNSTDNAAVVSVAFDSLFNVGSNSQLTVEVGYTVAAAYDATSKAAALTASNVVSAIPTNITNVSVALNDSTTGSTTDVFILAVRVTLVDATKQLVSGTNDTLNVTLTVVPASA